MSRVSGAPVSDGELIKDLQRVSEIIGTTKVTQMLYAQHGNYDATTIGRRFGSWNEALEIAELNFSNRVDITDEALYENILVLWQYCGRQPRRKELSYPPSTISQSPYLRRFRSWTNALQAFIDYANASDAPADPTVPPISHKPRTSRDPSLRLRFKVLQRDNFRCQACGASPALDPSVCLHVDHIVPWSDSGETTLDNLQTLCADCNLGKGNLTLTAKHF